MKLDAIAPLVLALALVRAWRRARRLTKSPPFCSHRGCKRERRDAGNQGCRDHPCPRARWSGHRPGCRYPRAHSPFSLRDPRSVFCDIHSPLRACARAAVVLGPGPQQAARSRPNGSERTWLVVTLPPPEGGQAGSRAKFTRSREGPLRFSRCARRFRSRSRPPLRAAGALSRVAGRGGGTTLPGKLLWKLDPGAIDRLARKLPRGAVLVSATNGKTTSAAMLAEILRPRVRIAHNASGANLVSGGRLDPAPRTRCGARSLRGRRGRALRGCPPRQATRSAPWQSLPRPARPLRRARDRRRPLARRRRRAAGHLPRRQRRRSTGW